MGRDLRILLAEAAGGGVARVGEGLATRGVRVLVQANEAVLGHVDLAAHLNRLAEAAIGDLSEAIRGERMRDVGDRQHVGGDVLASGAVTSRRRANKLRITICEGDAQTVDLELAGVGNGALRRGAQGLVRTGKPLVKLLEVHRVID